MKIFYSLFLILLFTNLTFGEINFELRASKLFFLNKNFGVLIKAPKTVAVTLDGGESWKNIVIDTKEVLKKVVFINDLDGWVFADSSLYSTNDAGATWSLNHTFSDFGISSLYFQNKEIGFVTGATGVLEHQTRIYRTENGGTSWNTTKIDTTFDDVITDISIGPDSLGVALSRFTMYKTQDGGSNWINLPHYFPVSGDGQITPENIRILNNNIYLIGWLANVVAQGFVKVSTDEGNTFAGIGNNQTFKFGIKDQFILNGDSIWLSTNAGEIYITNNGGYKWDTLNIDIDQFCFVSNTEAFGLSGEKLLFTNDGWKTHTIVDPTVTNVKEHKLKSNSFKLNQNYPNPFNPTSTIEFEVPQSENVNLTVYNLLGEIVIELFSGKLKAGAHKINFDGSNLSSGIYFARLSTEKYSKSIKMLLLK